MPNASDLTEARSKGVDTKQISATPPSANHSSMPKWYIDIFAKIARTSAPHMMGTTDEFEKAMAPFVELYRGVGPKTATEGMLASQMILAHNQAMDCLSRANIPNQTLAGRSEYLKHAEKLMMVLAHLVEALDKHRGKGQQQINVQHVNVASGGQAVVGNIATGKGPMDKKPDRTTPRPASIEHQHQDHVSFALDSQKTVAEVDLPEDDDIC